MDSKLVYGIAWYATVLFLTLFQTGYIQPDEFFQNPEITAGDIFNITHFRPWEFSTGNALRTISIPYITSGSPFLLLRTLENLLHFRSSAMILLLLPRLIMLTLLPVLHFFLRELATFWRVPIPAIDFVFRTSYLTFVFLPRTFSNSTEIIFFAALLYFVMMPKHKHRFESFAALSMGFVSALGIFNRPTFLAFGLVPWIYFLSNYKLRTIILGIISGAVSCAILIAVDSLYYGRFVITPLQFILYNIDPKNNAAHGLHPRYFHLFVSLPQLFGPLLICIFKYGPLKLFNREKFLIISSVIPLLLISVIPHQEPRFLLALSVPIFLLTAKTLYSSRRLCSAWLLFNIIAGIVFGFLHQGGVTQSLPVVRDLMENHHSVKVFYYKTYIPPFYTLRLPREDSNRVIDLGLNKLEPGEVGRFLGENQGISVFIITPATINLESLKVGNVSRTLYRRFCPHWSFEAAPDYMNLFTKPDQLCLNMWMISP